MGRGLLGAFEGINLEGGEQRRYFFLLPKVRSLLGHDFTCFEFNTRCGFDFNIEEKLVPNAILGEAGQSWQRLAAVVSRVPTASI